MVQSITPSCINEVMSCRVSTTPVPGMLGTMFVGSDRYTVVCIEVKSRTKVRLLSHVSDKYLVNRFTKDGIEYIPEADLKTLVEHNTPNLEYLTSRYGEIDGLYEYNFAMRRGIGIEYSLRKNGRWMPKGCGAWGTSSVHWGYGDSYLDPSF